MSVTFTKEPDDLFVISVQGVLTFEDIKEVEKKASEGSEWIWTPAR